MTHCFLSSKCWYPFTHAIPTLWMPRTRCEVCPLPEKSRPTSVKLLSVVSPSCYLSPTSATTFALGPFHRKRHSPCAVWASQIVRAWQLLPCSAHSMSSLQREKEMVLPSVHQHSPDCGIWVHEYFTPSWFCLPNNQPALTVVRPGDTARDTLELICKVWDPLGLLSWEKQSWVEESSGAHMDTPRHVGEGGALSKAHLHSTEEQPWIPLWNYAQ